MSDFKLEIYADKVVANIDDLEEKALNEIGMFVQGKARENITAVGAVDTGDLRGRMAYKVNVGTGVKEVVIGSGAEHGLYVEKGTGIFNSGGRKTPWIYQRADGKFVRTRGMKARPFLNPAVMDNLNKIESFVRSVFRNGMGK